LSKKTFECAEVKGATFITQVKDNQEELRKQIEHGCRVQSSVDQWIDRLDKAHGRIEQRKYEVYTALPMLNKWEKDWPYIRYIIRVTRYREEIGKSKPSETIHYYVTNGNLSAKEYAKHIRDHWFIENKVHYIKDVAFQEDTQKKHCNPFVYAICIDIALNIMRSKGSNSIKSTLYKNSLDFMQLMKNYGDML
jgi:predicted transposase YbfD/YdcC